MNEANYFFPNLFNVNDIKPEQHFRIKKIPPRLPVQRKKKHATCT
jgi:hypothetical protein